MSRQSAPDAIQPGYTCCMDQIADYDCPHCGESIQQGVDPSAGREQRFTEDCPVCCNPNMLSIRFDDEGHATVDAAAE